MHCDRKRECRNSNLGLLCLLNEIYVYCWKWWTQCRSTTASNLNPSSSAPRKWILIQIVEWGHDDQEARIRGGLPTVMVGKQCSSARRGREPPHLLRSMSQRRHLNLSAHQLEAGPVASGVTSCLPYVARGHGIPLPYKLFRQEGAERARATSIKALNLRDRPYRAPQLIDLFDQKSGQSPYHRKSGLVSKSRSLRFR